MTKDTILNGGCMIAVDDTLNAGRLFLHLFRDNPQSLPQCFLESVYQCRGGTWRVVPQTEAQRTETPIYKATDLFKKLKS